MKRFIAFGAFVICVILVLFAQPAMQTAYNGLELWWQTVLPTLFPFFVCTTLIERSGAFNALAKRFSKGSKRLHISAYTFPVLFLGSMCGYPCGARLCGMLLEDGRITQRDAQYLGTVCNLCSPMFIIGALAGGILQKPNVFATLLIGHYASALLIGVVAHFMNPSEDQPKPIPPLRDTEPWFRMLPGAISDGMLGMIKVGGSIVFFLVLVKMLEITGIVSLLSIPLEFVLETLGLGSNLGHSVVSGMFEMTGGCYLLAQSGITLRATVTLCSFLISFGGLCIMVQAMSFLSYPKPSHYLLTKLVQGIASAVITWMVFPLFGSDTVMVMAQNANQYLVNALSSFVVLGASSLGIAVAMMLAILIGKKHTVKTSMRRHNVHHS